MLQKELIGKKVKVISAANKSLENLQGVIIDETKFLFHIQTSKGIKKIPKKGTMFQITEKDKEIEVKGDLLVATPEDRIKLVK